MVSHKRIVPKFLRAERQFSQKKFSGNKTVPRIQQNSDSDSYS
jgi:hypothetical protein